MACDHSSNMAEVECLANGAIKGPPASEYQYRSCQTPTCYCNLPGGLRIPRGTSRYFYKTEEVGCSESCYTNENRTRVTCSSSGELSGDLSIAKFSSCQVPDCDCELSSGLKVVFGRELTLYSKDKVACGQKCSDFSGRVSCMTRNTASATPSQALNYQFSSCLQEACDGEGGGNGGGTGNDYGPGQGWFDDGGGGGGGGPGAPINTIRISKSFCETPWKAAKDEIRNLSGNLNGKVSEGSSFVAFDVETVDCGDTCSNHSLVRMCVNGKLSGAGKFKFKTCRSICKN